MRVLSFLYGLDKLFTCVHILHSFLSRSILVKWKVKLFPAKCFQGRSLHLGNEWKVCNYENSFFCQNLNFEGRYDHLFIALKPENKSLLPFLSPIRYLFPVCLRFVVHNFALIRYFSCIYNVRKSFRATP